MKTTLGLESRVVGRERRNCKKDEDYWGLGLRV